MNNSSNQLLRAEHYDNLKVGDKVYPAYDAKPGRITEVIITDISPDKNTITVKGKFWGEENTPDLEVKFTRKIDLNFYNEVFYYAYVQYKEDEPTLMQCLGIEPDQDDDNEKDELENYPNGGDYYRLYTPSHFNEWIKDNILSKDHLETQLK